MSLLEREILDAHFEVQRPRISETRTGQDRLDYRLPDHDFWYVAKGGGRLIRGGESHSVGPGTLHLFHPGERISVMHRPGIALRVFLCHFRIRENPGLGERLRAPNAVHCRDRRVHQFYSQALATEKRGFPDIARGLLIKSLFAFLLEHGALGTVQARRPRTESPDRLEILESYIDAHLVEPISLRDLSARVGVDASTVIRLFRTHRGLTPHQYLLARRIEGAKVHLEAGRSVRESAARSGFADPGTFTREFRRQEGRTPRAYQKDFTGMVV